MASESQPPIVLRAVYDGKIPPDTSTQLSRLDDLLEEHGLPVMMTDIHNGFGPEHMLRGYPDAPGFYVDVEVQPPLSQADMDAIYGHVHAVFGGLFGGLMGPALATQYCWTR